MSVDGRYVTAVNDAEAAEEEYQPADACTTHTAVMATHGGSHKWGRGFLSVHIVRLGEGRLDGRDG